MASVLNRGVVSFSPLKKQPSEEVCAFPLRVANTAPEPPLDHTSTLELPLQQVLEGLKRISQVIWEYPGADRSAVRGELEIVLRGLDHLSSLAWELEARQLRNLLHHLQECIECLKPDENVQLGNSNEPELERLIKLEEEFKHVLQSRANSESPVNAQVSPTPANSDITGLAQAVNNLTDKVNSLAGFQVNLGKQMQMLSLNGGSAKFNGQDATMESNQQEWSLQPCRELPVGVPTNGRCTGQQSHMTTQRILDSMSSDQLRQLAIDGLMSRMNPAYPPVPQVNVHNLISTNADAAAATEQTTTQESNIVNKVKNTLKQARANLIPLLIGGGLAILFHNHIPFLKRISPGGRGRSRHLERDLSHERVRTRRTAATAEEALEECHESMREWREYSRRARGPFQHVPEPGPKCDLRALRSRVLRSAAESPPSGGSGLRGGQADSNSDIMSDNPLWRMIAP